jgi:Bacterial transferase hexapeptide (six repeats)
MLTQVDWNASASVDGRTETLVFEGLERLAPRGVAGPALDAWLSAPIAGDPLYRRLFEPLVGSGIRSCVAESGRVADALGRITRRHPCFSYVLTSDPFLLSNGERRASFPAAGILDLGPQSGGDTARLHRTDDASSLLNLSRMALEGDLLGRPARGVFEGEMLRGPETSIQDRVRVSGLCAVGARSRVASDVHLGPGAIIGEGCLIGEGARLANCIVLDGAIIPAGAHLDDVIWFPGRGR